MILSRSLLEEIIHDESLYGNPCHPLRLLSMLDPHKGALTIPRGNYMHWIFRKESLSSPTTIINVGSLHGNHCLILRLLNMMNPYEGVLSTPRRLHTLNTHEGVFIAPHYDHKCWILTWESLPPFEDIKHVSCSWRIHFLPSRRLHTLNTHEEVFPVPRGDYKHQIPIRESLLSLERYWYFRRKPSLTKITSKALVQRNPQR